MWKAQDAIKTKLLDSGMMSKVSVVMTTYNGEKYLREQLDSLYSQTRIPDEVVAVDDCSSDSTIDILKEYHQKFGLLYFINESRLGINQNFGKSLSLCSGDYVAICDQDDIWFPQKIEKSLQMMREVEQKNPVLIVSDVVLTDENLQILRKFQPKKYTSSSALSILGNARQGCCLFMNRKLLEIILPIPDSAPLHNIYDFYIAVMGVMCGEKYYLPEPLMYYRLHAGNAVGKSMLPKRSAILIWLRGKIQGVYEFSVQSRGTWLKEIQIIKQDNFRSDRRALFVNLLEICRQENLLIRLFRLMQTPCLSGKEKAAVISNSIIYHHIQILKSVASRRKPT